jgi:hypothetical protein
MSTVRVGNSFLEVPCNWAELQTFIATKVLKLQYGESDSEYTLFALDGPIIYTLTLFKGAVPAACDQSQEDNDAWKADFEANHKPTANQPLSKRQPDGSVWVVPTGREGSETIQTTVNFSDKCTWWFESARIAGETLTDSGDGLTFSSAHTHWIDVEHGRIFDEDAIKIDVEHQYAVVVYVNGVEKARREAFMPSGGDYEVNYELGTITFFASQAGQTVTASYSYATGSTFTLKPTEGRALDLDYAEVDVSTDIAMNDTIRFEVFGYVQVFAPQLWSGFDPPGPFPTNYLIPIQTTRYKTTRQIKHEAIGVSAKMPALSPSTGRGNNAEWVTLPFRYGAIRRLWSRYGMELRISLEHNQAFGGDNATATFYCISRHEAEIST